MYRCSLSCRVVRQFETVNSVQPLCTRYDVFCPQLHFSLSDMQLPMFLRLLHLALALYYGDLPSSADMEQPVGVPNVKDGDNGLSEGIDMTYIPFPLHLFAYVIIMLLLMCLVCS